MFTTHHIPKTQNAFAFDATLPPVLAIEPPATITFETDDITYRRLSRGEAIQDIGLENFNVVTGPVYVHGAEPGDALRIDIIDVTVSSAWSAWIPGLGGLGDRTNELHVRQIPIKDAQAVINPEVRVPLEPMIGCIGVAPAQGRSSTFMPAYPWGGNMDLRELSPGATLFLPIQVPGALLSVGDLHAAMGAGERTGVSLEAAGEATLCVSIEKEMLLAFPRLRVGEMTICVGMGETLNNATQVALDQAFDLLVNDAGLAPFDAYAYVSARVGVHFGGPAYRIVLASVPDIAE